jgi:predicted porin
MKRYGLGFALVLLAGPAFAADLAVSAYPAAPPPHGSPLYSPTSLVTGDISFGIGWSGENGNVDSNSATGHVAGRTNFGLWSGWNEELEATGVWNFNGGEFNGGGFSHTYYKNQSWAGGFVIGGGETDPFQTTSSNGFLTTGVEGVVFMPKGSIVSQVDYTSGSGLDFWTLALEGRYYFEPNTKLTGQVAWNSDHNGASNEWLLYGALEHRWTGTPFSNWVSASWRPASGDNQFGVMVGVRYLFDQPNGTLQSHDYEIPFSQGHDSVF